MVILLKLKCLYTLQCVRAGDCVTVLWAQYARLYSSVYGLPCVHRHFNLHKKIGEPGTPLLYPMFSFKHRLSFDMDQRM